MTGLLLKDFLNLKRHSKVYLILMIFYFILGIASKDFAMFGSMITVFAAIMPITSMAYDEKNNWDRYALTMPISRKDLVLSRYIFGMIFLCAAFIITLVINLVLGGSSIFEVIMTNLGIFALGIIIMSVIFPVIFKFGVEKGRIFMMMVLLAPTAAMVVLSKLGFTLQDEKSAKAFIYFLPVIGIAAFAASVLISVSIYGKKEF
ncbi:MAG TPA: ABC-2 transporter permease [Clostridiales bacterium]|nr:ABC-2 transporter permease [Clostridiales bacterium]